MVDVTLAQIQPAIIAVAFYSVVIFLAEVSRKIVDKLVKKGSIFYIFLIEFIAVAQQCTCVYENAVMIKHYGALGFGSAVFFLLLVTSAFNRGAFVSPFTPIEHLLYGSITTEKFLTVLLAQTLGGYSAYRIADGFWYYTYNYSLDHASLHRNLPCAINYKVSYYFAFAYEVFGCFLIRMIIPRIPERLKKFFIPLTFASFLSFALVYIGVPGLNPVTASSRMQGCPGLDLQWFIITYWVAPTVGWLLASRLDRQQKLRAGGKNKKTK